MMSQCGVAWTTAPVEPNAEAGHQPTSGDGHSAAGTAIIIVAVALATSAKVEPQVGGGREPELPACEAGAD